MVTASVLAYLLLRHLFLVVRFSGFDSFEENHVRIFAVRSVVGVCWVPSFEHSVLLG